MTSGNHDDRLPGGEECEEPKFSSHGEAGGVVLMGTRSDKVRYVLKEHGFPFSSSSLSLCFPLRFLSRFFSMWEATAATSAHATVTVPATRPATLTGSGVVEAVVGMATQ